MKTVVWFRKDLRLDDNPALFHACQSGKVLPLFIADPAELKSLGGASKWWLHHSLACLNKNLNPGTLGIAEGEPEKVLIKIAEEYRIDAVYWNRNYEPKSVQRDKRIKKAMTDRGIRVESFNGSLLFEPWEVQNNSGKPYQVFTPFWKKCLTLTDRIKVVPAPKAAEYIRLKKSVELSRLKLLPEIGWDSGLYENWTPGAESAKKSMQSFAASGACRYSSGRNIPSEKGTSRISPHLRFGEISPRQIFLQIEKEMGKSGDGMRDMEVFLSEIGWREFAYHLLYYFPDTVKHPLKKKFRNLGNRMDRKLFKAWTSGNTGYPIVDAGMRELWHTGWMHNRVRMIAGSFLTKDLFIPWQNGAEWFWDTLVDADLASNTLGWQWVAGCGADAAPYFRVFNPVLQGEKFDPDGRYVRRWVPEISMLPDKFIHKPWMMPEDALKKIGFKPGKDYPLPVVDHGECKKKALKAYEGIR